MAAAVERHSRAAGNRGGVQLQLPTNLLVNQFLLLLPLPLLLLLPLLPPLLLLLLLLARAPS